MPDSLRYEFEPDPDAKFRQIHLGFNGPGERGVDVYRSSEEAKKSQWLRKAIGGQKLRTILREIDFESSVLLAVYPGSRSKMSGNVHLTNAKYDTNSNLGYSMMIGIVDETCAAISMTGNPFVLAIVEITEPGWFEFSSSASWSNFLDKCPNPTGTD